MVCVTPTCNSNLQAQCELAVTRSRRALCPKDMKPPSAPLHLTPVYNGPVKTCSFKITNISKHPTDTCNRRGLDSNHQCA
jgi:hypothetical protein